MAHYSRGAAFWRADPSFSADICSNAVCEVTHRRVSRRHFPPLLRLWEADTRMGHGHTPSPQRLQPQLAAEPPHSAPRSITITITIESLQTPQPTCHEASTLIKFSYIQSATWMAQQLDCIMYKKSLIMEACVQVYLCSVKPLHANNPLKYCLSVDILLI